MLYVSDSIDILNCCDQAVSNIEVNMRCLAIKFLHELFYNSQFKKYNCSSMQSYNRRTRADVPSYIIVLCAMR